MIPLAMPSSVSHSRTVPEHLARDDLGLALVERARKNATHYSLAVLLRLLRALRLAAGFSSPSPDAAAVFLPRRGLASSPDARFLALRGLRSLSESASSPVSGRSGTDSVKIGSGAGRAVSTTPTDSKVRRHYSNARADRPTSASAAGWRAARSHAGRGRGCGRGRLRWLRRGELLAHRCRWRGESDLVISATTAQVDDVGIVRVLKDAQEIPFAQALAVASEKLAGGGANLTRARGSSLAYGATNEIEGFFAREA